MILCRNKYKNRGNNMNEKIYYSAEDIAKMLGVSMGKAYKILKEKFTDKFKEEINSLKNTKCKES